MDSIKSNIWGSAGVFFGAIALIIGIFHITLGPFSPAIPLETRVAEKVSAVKKGIIAGIKGEKPEPKQTAEKAVNIDRVLINTDIALALVALLCAFVAGVRKERKWFIRAALICGGGTLALHAFIFGISMMTSFVVVLVIVWLILLFLGG